MEHERRVRKRLARLSEAAEDSFSHIKRQLRSDSNMPGAQSSLDPIETAHAVFPAMARSMQKYLRTTRYVPFECAQKIIWTVQIKNLLNKGVKALKTCDIPKYIFELFSVTSLI